MKWLASTLLKTRFELFFWLFVLAFFVWLVLTARAPAVSYAQERDDAPFSTARTLTAGTSYPPGRAIGINATVAGNVILDLADGSSTITVPVQVGYTQLPYAVIKVESGSTATATYTDLY